VGRDEIGPWAAFEVGGVLHRLRRLSPGRFWMGSPRTEVGRSENEGPQHEVRLTRGFWLGETAVTQALWEAVMGTNPSRFPSPTRPVEQVSWNDAQEFLLRLEERVPGLGARLPSEAEWEYACRAGTTTSTYAGELEILEAFDCPQLDPIAWYGGNSGADQVLTKPGSSSQTSSDAGSAAGTYPAAEKAANPWGLYDMLGNVYEWCQDGLREYGEDSADSSENVVDPHGPAAGQGRVIRGGSWADVARHVRAASRFSRHPDARKDLLGFRLARSDDGTPASRRT
jgi:formylglycine-generating enzyme required for sulfatase activity